MVLITPGGKLRTPVRRHQDGYDHAIPRLFNKFGQFLPEWVI